ncbi:MAG: TolC family protein [Candidatus Eremiobacteraeota bacterium]|nr:TolC family protein [Candidatus Eremiobacteraeota bacterium]
MKMWRVLTLAVPLLVLCAHEARGQQTPASSPTSIPYPAYGTPAPGVSEGAPVIGVPQRVTLAQAIAIGAARSPVLASARADQALAQSAVSLARTGALPALSLNAGTTRFGGGSSGISGSGATGTGGFSGGGSAGGNGSFISNTANFGLRQLIFDGGRVATQIRAASLSEVASAQTYQRQLQTVSFTVANAYYNALAAESATVVAVAVVRQNQTGENLVRAQVRAGTTARADIATAELPTVQARVAVVRAQGTELSAVAALANAMGIDANANVRPVDDTSVIRTASLSQIPLLTYDQAVTRALSLRPDFVSAQRSLEAAEASLRAARLGRAPTISGNASLGVNSTDSNGSQFRSSNQIGATFSLPVFDQGLSAAQTEQARAQIDRAVATLQTTRLGIQLNVKQALVNLISARAASDQVRAELAKARQVLGSTQAQYRAGVTTLPLLLNAQVGLTQAENDQLTAVYGLRQAEQNFLFALGENDLQLTSPSSVSIRRGSTGH